MIKLYFNVSIIIILILFYSTAVESSSGVGSTRRFLRSIAARGGLAQVQLPINSASTLSETSGFIINLKNLLSTKELVKIKTSYKKKNEVKAISDDIAKISKSEVVQVIGHTILLYRDNGGDITQQLNEKKQQESQNCNNDET